MNRGKSPAGAWAFIQINCRPDSLLLVYLGIIAGQLSPMLIVIGASLSEPHIIMSMGGGGGVSTVVDGR